MYGAASSSCRDSLEVLTTIMLDIKTAECERLAKHILLIYKLTSRVPAVLLRVNSTKSYVSYRSFLPESLSQARSFDTYR
jgi:hypothetical protein